MTLSDVAIQRPILTWMMTLALIVFGVMGYQRLGVDQYPSMEFPVVTVSAMLEGAAPEGMEEDVTDVLEEQLNTLAGVRSIRSTTYPGAVEAMVEFELGTDIDVAAQDVRDRIARARAELPPELEPPLVGKFDMNSFAVLWAPLVIDRPLAEASEYVRRQVSPVIETIPGVAGLQDFGSLERNIRIWLDGDALRSRGLVAGDVLEALRREHVEVPGGTIESGWREYAVKTDAEFRSLAELERLVVHHDGEAAVLLRDLARLEDGTEEREVVTHFNGEPTIALGVLRQSGGNTVAVVDETVERFEQLAPTLPEGIEIAPREEFVDFSDGVREAVAETQFALIFGALLAVLVVFVFLRRTRPTLIVAAAIPISLLATFGLVWLFDYTLNTMTLLGMTLAVGVVIDDAIVVLENIERHREGGKAAREAASVGTREIAFAATAATFSVAAVFVPVVFVEGLVGNFLGEFGLTVAGSVLISLFVALTLTPMLAARMPPPAERSHGSVYHRLERGFGALESGYRRLLQWTLGHRAATLGVAGLAFALALVCGAQLESEFFPPTDMGLIFIQSETPPGTSLDATAELMMQDEAWLLSQPETASLMAAAGTQGGHSEVHTSNQAVLFAALDPLEERERSVFELIDDARRELGQVPGREMRIINLGAGFSATGPSGDFHVELLGNRPLTELDELADRMLVELEQVGGFVDLDKSLKLGRPELRVLPDREKAAALGVDARSVASTIRMMIGGMDVGVFKESGRRYDIRMRLEEDKRATPDAVERLYVRARDGGAVALRNLVEVRGGAAPSEITRTNRQRSVSLFANLDGRTLGSAIEEARRIADEVLPEGVTLALAGQAESMEESGRQFMLALGLAVLVIYMILAAQFESLIHPLTVMLALPLALVGALGGLLVFGQTLNLFSLIGIVLLFGLVTKNSILLVDYANQLRARGLEKREAMAQAAPVRMRPVLMTAISMIFGVLPAAIGLGPGAESRAPMAIATACGMLSSTLLTLLVVPVFYLLLDDLSEGARRGLRRLLRRPAPA